MSKFAVAVLAMVLGAGTLSSANKAEPPPKEKELVQFVRDARRLGLKAPAIKKNAMALGWPAAAVDEAIAYAKRVKAGPADSSPGISNTAPPSAPSQILPAPVLSQAPVAPDAAGLAGNQTQSSSTPAPRPGASKMTDSADIPKNRGVPEDYHIGAGDVLQVSVWKEPDVSVPTVVVRPDGKIAIPLLKEVAVVGMTPTQAEKLITAGLARFINAAEVTIVVTAINSKKVYVVGAVRREGPLPYTYRMSVIQAISEAGGLTDYAKRKKIYILRTENGKEYRLPFNYDEVIRGEKMEQNIQLLPDDSLVIPH